MSLTIFKKLVNSMFVRVQDKRIFHLLDKVISNKSKTLACNR